MATKSQEILLKGNTTNASAVPSSLKVREIAINTLDRSLFTNDGNSIVKLYTGTTKWFDVNGNANNALKLGGVLASEYINKEAFNSHINNSIIHITANERTAWNNKWDYNEETIKGVKVNAAVLSDSATKLTNSRNIFGLPFDGTKDIDGYIKVNVGSSPDTIGDYIGLRLHRSVASSDIFGVALALTAYQNKGIAITGGGYGGEINYYNGTSFSHIMSFSSSGNILIGTYTDNGYKLQVNGKGYYSDDLIVDGEVVAVAGEGTPAGVTDYSALTGKPSINGVTLISGNNTLASLGIQAAGDYATISGVTTLLADYATKAFVLNNYVGKSAFNNHTSDTDIHITAAERTAWNAKWDYNEETIKGVKVNAAVSADALTSDAGTSAIPIYFDGGIPIQCTPSALFYGFANGYDASAGGRVLGITIAGYTRKVVVAYSTLAGSADKLATARTLWGQSFDGSSDVSGDLNLGASKLYWNGDSANYYMSCSGTQQMTYNIYSGHIFSTLGGVERMRICDNGDVGIGTTNPLFALDIYRENKGDLLRLTSNTTYVCAIYKPSSGTRWSVGANDNNQFYWWNSQKKVIVTYIDNVGNLTTTGGGAFGGNVLIGTTTDNGYKLQVNGSERVYGDLIVDGEVSALIA